MPVLVELFPCRTDNYGYLIHDLESRRTAAIDAPDAQVIEAVLRQRGWTLTDVLLTHHHRDHIEGVTALKSDFNVTVTGPRSEADKIQGLDVGIGPGDIVMLGNTALLAIGTPGHTLGHLAYYDATGGHLFSGDALFSLGCGRMFEGTPGPMWEGLKALRALPEQTLLYCGHEYTIENARFAETVDPQNAALRIRISEARRIRGDGHPTIPVTLGMEKRTNPFLRADQPALARAMGLDTDLDPSAVFAALRQAKDDFT